MVPQIPWWYLIGHVHLPKHLVCFSESLLIPHVTHQWPNDRQRRKLDLD